MAVQFNPEDEPVFNPFDLPTMCDDEDASRTCCDPCTAWLFCLKRTPIEIHLPGLNFENWLKTVSMSADKILPSSGVNAATFSGGGDDDVFNGTFLAVPDSRQLSFGDCGERLFEDKCYDNDFGSVWGPGLGGSIWGWWGWWWGYIQEDYDPEDYEYYAWYYYWDVYYTNSWRATHHTVQGRTLLAPAAKWGQAKKFYVDVKVACEEDEELGTCLRFWLLVKFGWEKAFPDITETFDDYGYHACNPAVLGAIEEEGWEGVNEQIDYCAPIMKSALIPIEGLAWEDLDEIPLETIPPPVWSLVDADPDYWIVTGGSHGGLVFPELGVYRAVGWHSNHLDPDSDEALACGGDGISPVSGSHETGHTCHSGVWLPSGYSWGTHHSYHQICVPDPVTVNGEPGDAFLKVLAHGCFPADDCTTCIPDIEEPKKVQSVKIDFTVYGAGGDNGCTRTFNAVYPECIEPAFINWSFGKVGSPVTHTVKNITDDDLTDAFELITLTILDVRGCIYCVTKPVGCGCCEGVSGTLSITPIGTCDYEICAETSGECPTGGPPYFEITYSEPGFTQTFGLGNGQCHSLISAEGGTLAYRFYEQLDGCSSDTIEVDLLCAACNCCIGAIPFCYVNISGWGTFDSEVCAACGMMNTTFELMPTGIGATGGCQWEFHWYELPPEHPLADGVPCRPDDDPPYYTGIEMFLQITCNPGDTTCPAPNSTLLFLQINMTEGGANYYRCLANGVTGGGGPPGSGVPADCSGLAGEMDIDPFSVYIGGCNPSGSVVTVEMGSLNDPPVFW